MWGLPGGGSGGYRGEKSWGKETWLGVVNTQYGAHMMLCNYALETCIILLTSVTPINWIKRKKQNKNIEGSDYIFLQRMYTNGQRAHEKIVNIINLREMQISIRRITSHPPLWVWLKRQIITGVRNVEPSYHTGWNIVWYGNFGEQSTVPQRLICGYLWSSNCTPRYIPQRNENSCSPTSSWMVLIRALYRIAKFTNNRNIHEVMNG